MIQPIIKTENLCFSYSKSKNDISALDLEVPRGSVYGFLGPNGSGKTTTIRLLLGLLRKQKGSISLFGQPFEENRIDNLARVGALIENPSLYGHLNARENLKIAARYRGGVPKNRIEEVLEIVKLSYVKKKKVKAFSLGMKQRLGLAISLLNKPELLILDEPANGLDPKGIIEMRSLIRELNEQHDTTIFISSHLLSEIEKTCSHVGIIREGKMLFQNTVAALKNSQTGKLVVEIETNDTSSASEIAKELQMNPDIADEQSLNVVINRKDEIPGLIDNLRNRQIAVYQVRIKDNLEELFLSLTEN
ncbi:ATP-binding cassette domain-containing protein [Leptobacterium flavescens]|uniref:ATP-binding cassette domain-containing protein n=1 Tax=Leptobacterium flavescens TaxID=472055 RepID=A0A6P0UUT6_9FLAO|nr:ABC transporter ATP-binding protein [Leptobacterium flavescens]NER14583.1 ATP-binding cassette domain-containing protein [Leptobacterium flavescens]